VLVQQYSASCQFVSRAAFVDVKRRAQAQKLA